MHRLKITTITLATFLMLVLPAWANGKPITIYLNFLPQFSNTGSTAARGQARVSIGEAWLDLTADGLPQLQGEQYEVWLQEAETGKRLSLGTFNADENGHVAYYMQFNNIPVADYQYLLITVEPNPDPNPDPDARITIAGVFPNPQLVDITPTTASASAPDAGASAAPPPPQMLPVTGDASGGQWTILGGIILLSAGVFLGKRAFNRSA